MRVLVTGAHGFMGSHLVTKLSQEGHLVRALVSPWGDAGVLAALPNVDIVRADITDEAQLKSVFEGCELVYHAAARVADYGPDALFTKVNVAGTRHVLRGSSLAGVKRLVLLSSVAVHAYSGFRNADPRTQPRDGSVNAYARSKIAAEDLLQEAALETVVVRPGLWPFGPRDPNFAKVVAALSAGQLPLVDGGRAVINTAYIENLVDGLLLAGSQETAAGKVYVIADAGAPSWRELFGEISKQLGVNPPKVNLPGRAAEAIGAASEQLYAKLAPQQEPPLTRYRGTLMRRDVHFSLLHSERELGYSPKVPWQEGVRRTLGVLKRSTDGRFE